MLKDIEFKEANPEQQQAEPEDVGAQVIAAFKKYELLQQKAEQGA